MKKLIAPLTLLTLCLGCSSGSDSVTPAPAVPEAPSAEATSAAAEAKVETPAPDAEGGHQHGSQSHEHGASNGASEAQAASGDFLATPEGARVFFVEPTDKAEVSSPLRVVMGMEGMVIKPAGELVAGTGHHHIVVDGQPVARGTVVPADATHIHYGKGQTETELELSPGSHTLTLQFANGAHQSYGPEMANTITITVK